MESCIIIIIIIERFKNIKQNIRSQYSQFLIKRNRQITNGEKEIVKNKNHCKLAPVEWKWMDEISSAFAPYEGRKEGRKEWMNEWMNVPTFPYTKNICTLFYILRWVRESKSSVFVILIFRISYFNIQIFFFW